MRLISLLVLLLIGSSTAFAQTVIRGPIVGGVTDHSARITLQLSGSAAIALEYSTTSDFSSNVVRSSATQAVEANKNFATLDLPNLSSSTRYYLRPVINDAVNSFTSERSFVTFPSEGKDSAFQFTFGSCYFNTLRPSNVFHLMKQDNPLLFLEIGDWSYPDQLLSPVFSTQPELVERSYELKYDLNTNIDSFVSSRAVDYVYDDHDFGGENSDGTNPGRVNALQGYTSYFPHYTLPNPAAGIWHSFKVGNAEFFMLDTRSERSPNKEAIVESNGAYQFSPPPGHSLLRGTHTTGQDQLTWLRNTLKQSTARWKIIISGVTWNPAYRNLTQLAVAIANFKKDPSLLYALADNWSAFPEDQDSVIAIIKGENIKNVIVCSGDVHNAMMDDGSKSVIPEIVSANLQIYNSNLYGQLDSLNFAKSVWTLGGQKNDTVNTYGRITIATEPQHSLTMEILDERGKLIASHTLSDANASVPVSSNNLELISLSQTVEGVELHSTIRSNGITRLTISDVMGRVVTDATQFLKSGNSVYLPNYVFPSSGMYYITAETLQGVVSLKRSIIK